MRNKEGFTIIELLVVIAVIGILVLLAALGISNYIEKTKITRIQNDVRAVESIANAYHLEHGEYDTGGFLFSIDKLKESASQGHFYTKIGREKDVDENKTYEKLSSSIINDAHSSLTGTFIIDDDGNVAYVDKKLETTYSYQNIYTKYNDVKFNSFYGKTISTREYENDTEDIVFYGVTEEVLDGNEETYQRNPSIVTWDGNLTHREITITGKGHSGTRGLSAYSSPLYVRFLDQNGNVVTEESSNKESITVAHHEEVGSVSVIVPDGATQMEFYARRDSYDNTRLHEISVPEAKERPSQANVFSRTDSHSILLSWDSVNKAIIKTEKGDKFSITGNQVYLTPESFTSGEYKVILIDESGNGQEFTHVVKYENLMLSTTDFNRFAFDKDIETYSVGSGKINLRPGLAHREIQITGKGERGTGGVSTYSSSMLIRFLDKDENILKEVSTGKESVHIASFSSINTKKVIVPNKATQMEIYPSRDYRDNLELYDISFSEKYTRPYDSIINSYVNNNNIKLEWNHAIKTIINENNNIIETINNEITLPPRTFDKNVYNFIIIDEDGNGQEIKHVVNGNNLLLSTSDFDFQAFDENLETYSTGIGTLNLNTVLGVKNISITGAGNGKSLGSASLRTQFLNDEGTVIPEKSTNKTYLTVGRVSEVGTVNLVVPEGATKLKLYSSNSSEQGVKIYEISATN